MKWYQRIWRTKARKFLLIGLLIAGGVGTPLAVGIGTGLDEAINEVMGAERGEETQK